MIVCPSSSGMCYNRRENFKIYFLARASKCRCQSELRPWCYIDCTNMLFEYITCLFNSMLRHVILPDEFLI